MFTCTCSSVCVHGVCVRLCVCLCVRVVLCVTRVDLCPSWQSWYGAFVSLQRSSLWVPLQLSLPHPHIPGPLLNHFPSQPLRLWAHFLGGIEIQTQILVMHGILNTYLSIGMKLYHDTQLQLMSHYRWCLSQVESIERGPEISVIKKNQWHWVSWRRTIFKADNRRQSTELYILAHRCVCRGGSCVMGCHVYTTSTTHSVMCGNGRDVPLLACSLVL